MATVKAMREAVRNQYIAQIMKALEAAGEDVGMSASNEFNMPIVLEDGTEDFIVVKVSVPTGSRDGEAYDGYAIRTEYTMKVEEKAIKAKAAAEAKEKKIARDKANREKLAASKAAYNK